LNRAHPSPCHTYRAPNHHPLPPQSDPSTSAKLKAASGLSLLDQRKYRQAARAFVEVSPELGYTYSEVGRPAEWLDGWGRVG